MIIFNVRRSSAIKVCYELLWYLNTYDFARGLALSSHSSSPSAAVVELSGRRVLPFLDPSAVGDRSRNLKFSTHHQDQSME